MDMRESVDSIKAELGEREGKGQLVIRPRQTGKTTALFEYIHEHEPGNVNVITCNVRMAQLMKQRYKEQYCDDPHPSFIPLEWVNNRDVRGTTRRWATDEVWPSSVIKRAPDYEYVDFLGGVGTPLCME
jgi:hypothetical protein